MKQLLLALSFCLPFCLALPLAAAEAPAPAAPAEPDLSRIARESFDNPLVQIETTMGSMIVELFPREAPETVANFLGLAEGSKPFIDPATGQQVTRPFYEGLIFHRVIDGFMIQGGSPTGLGNGGPGYTFRDEINARSLGLDKLQVIQDDGYPHPFLGVQAQEDFQRIVLMPLYRKMGITSQADLDARIEEVDAAVRRLTVKEAFENLGYRYTETVMSRAPIRGVLAMANSGPDTNGSQFFINLADTPWLTGKHTVFGKVRGGMNVLDAIGKVPVDAQDRPLEDVRILSIRRIE